MSVELSAIEWIEVIVALLLLIFTIFVFVWVVKYYTLPFNKFWKTRAMFVSATFVWILCILLSRAQFWEDHGLFSITDQGYKQLCQVTTVFTYGLSQPLFFITLLLMIRSKTNATNDLDLYNKHPNRTVMGWAFVWTLPLIAIHLIIVILNNYPSVKDPTNWWKSYAPSSGCVAPIISTLAFACFYAIFLVSYIFYSNKFGKTLINKKLLQRLWWSQIFFALFFPCEVILRFILSFTTKFQVTAQVLSHIFFFIDLVICIVGLLEFALFPVLDAAEYPLTDMTENLLDKGRKPQQHEPLEHGAIVLDNVVFQATIPTTTTGAHQQRSSSANLMTNTSSLPHHESSSTMQAYNSNISEQQSVEEFRKQMARYSSNV